MNHKQLIKECLKGNGTAQRLLYQEFAEPMLGVCYRYTKSFKDAEDVLQDGFVKVFNSLASYKYEGELGAWIRRIMVNTAIEMYRRNLRTLDMVEIEEGYNVPQTTFNMSELETKDLISLIRELSAGYRLVFNMYVIEGYSHKEIAAELGITEGASKSQLSRARAILKERIIKMEGSGYANNVG